MSPSLQGMKKVLKQTWLQDRSYCWRWPLSTTHNRHSLQGMHGKSCKSRNRTHQMPNTREHTNTRIGRIHDMRSGQVWAPCNALPDKIWAVTWWRRMKEQVVCYQAMVLNTEEKHTQKKSLLDFPQQTQSKDNNIMTQVTQMMDQIMTENPCHSSEDIRTAEDKAKRHDILNKVGVKDHPAFNHRDNFQGIWRHTHFCSHPMWSHYG